MTEVVDALFREQVGHFMPPPNYRVSEWADAHRRLPETSAAQGARWRTSRTPYLAGIMDAVNDPTVSKIALMKCAQSGGSEAISNIIGYHIEHDPCPMLVVHPTSSAADAWSKSRLVDMIRSTPALRAVVRDGRSKKGSHEAESTVAQKFFPGGFLALGGANSPNTFAQWSVRLAMGDDVDRFPPVVGEEGDPADLLANRTTTFLNALCIYVSTPTLKKGRIDTLFSRSDRRRYFVACPECGREDWITWNDPNHFRVAWDERDASTARIECPDEEHGGCGAHIDEPTRRLIITEASERPDRGWRPTATPQEPGLVGFHLPQMIATLGNVTLSNLVAKWLTAREKGRESLRVFINTGLAEGWEERGTRVEASTLMFRRVTYGPEGVEVPARMPVLTCGVDTQDDRFELTVMAWGPAMERAVVDVRVIPGSPKLAETRAQLLEALGRKYQHALGPMLPIHATCIDSGGHCTDEVYDFVLAHQSRRVFATKGFAERSGEPIVGKPSQKRYGKKPRPVLLWPINVDDAKGDVMNSLTLEAPGPGYMHLPLHVDTVNDEFIAQLCSEHRETRYNRAGIATHMVWVQDRDRNEGLDMAVLCLAAFKLLNPNIRQMQDLLKAAAAKEPVTPDREPVPAAPTPGAPAAPKPPARRVVESDYLGH